MNNDHLDCLTHRKCKKRSGRNKSETKSLMLGAEDSNGRHQKTPFATPSTGHRSFAAVWPRTIPGECPTECPGTMAGVWCGHQSVQQVSLASPAYPLDTWDSGYSRDTLSEASNTGRPEARPQFCSLFCCNGTHDIL